tara:strand:+ start:9512 stop:10381 length:870 start_codon:yes stop_codon:yes gene_type:complete
MKILVQNYINGESSEAGYFHETFSNIGLQCQMWSDNMSAYDKLDSYSPDVLVCHYMWMSHDIFKYFSNRSNMSLVLNVTGATQNEVEIIEDIITKNNVQAPFFYTNLSKNMNKVKPKKIKLHSIMNGADVFFGFSQQPSVEYDIDLGIVSDYTIGSRFSDAKEGIKSWHTLTTSPDLESADVKSDLRMMSLLFQNYKKLIVSTESGRVGQSFFDAVLYGKDVEFRGKYETQQENAQKDIELFLGKDKEKWRKRLSSNHTCLNRAKQLLSKLKHEEAEKAVDKLIKGIAL